MLKVVVCLETSLLSETRTRTVPISNFHLNNTRVIFFFLFFFSNRIDRDILKAHVRSTPVQKQSVEPNPNLQPGRKVSLQTKPRDAQKLSTVGPTKMKNTCSPLINYWSTARHKPNPEPNSFILMHSVFFFEMLMHSVNPHVHVFFFSLFWENY